MAVTLAVPPLVLLQAKGKWDESADELDGNWRRLAKASTDGLSAEVAAAVKAFREPWVDEIKACAQTAQANSDEIHIFGLVAVYVDEAQAEQVRTLLPWAYRNAEIHS